MITKEKRSQMVRYWWSKAEESLASARREFEAESFSFTMNRLYYAAFYGVSALLMESAPHSFLISRSTPGVIRS